MPSSTHLPAHLTSTHQVRVRFCETDLMQIVHHANYLIYFEEGRVRWLHRRGVAYENWVEQGIHLPVVETKVRYRRAAKFDDVLHIATTCTEVKRATVQFSYAITRNHELLVEGETLLASVGNDMKPKRIPENLVRIFRSAEID